MSDQDNQELVSSNPDISQANATEKPNDETAGKRSSLRLTIVGAILVVVGVVLTWDSMLWIFPEPYGVPCSDWKELMIALPILGAGWFLATREHKAIQQHWKWFAEKPATRFPLMLSGLILAICIVFNVEIGGPYWFTKSGIVTVQTGWNAGKSFNIRYRYAQPDRYGHCP
jgi:hypothetical protein